MLVRVEGAGQARSSWAVRSATAVDAAPLAVLALAPLAYGSVDLLFVATWCVVLALAVLLRPLRREGGRAAAYPPAAVAVATVAAVALLQLRLPVPAADVDDGWRAARELLGFERAEWSATRSGPWFALGAPLLFALVLQWSFEFARHKDDARRLVLAIVASGTLIAVAAIVLRAYAPGFNAGRASPAYAHVLTGPFVNRNAAAAYWGSCALVAWLWVLRDLERCRARDPGLGGLSAFAASKPAVAMAVALIVCAMAMVLTASRAVVMLTAALFVLTLGIRRYQNGAASGAVAVTVAVAVMALAGLLELGGGMLAQRIYARGLGDPFRWGAWRSTLAMIAAHPWLGVGLGNFEAAFPAYRDAALGSFGTWEHAHSVPLELAAELGLPAAVLIGAAWIVAGLHLLRGALARDGSGFYPLVGLGVGLLGTLHSLVDFSLLIPGYSIPFAALTGCGLARCRSRGRGVSTGTGVDGAERDGRASAPARMLHVTVATPLGRGGRGGIDQIMDEIRREHARAARPDLRLRFITTRGQGHIGISPLFLGLALGRLALAKAARRIDVLHVNLSSHGSETRKRLLCRAARLLRVPYVIHLHGSRYRQFHTGLDARGKAATAVMFRGAARVVVLGEVWKRFLVDAGIVDGTRVVVVPNASRAPRRGKLPASGDVLILFLGRVGARKGVPVLVRALGGMAGRSGWRAIIAGDGEVEGTVAALAAAGVAARVELTGWVDKREVERLLARADVLVLPSHDENLPMSVIEGMAFGLAVVATPVGAVPEIVTDGVTGLLVPAGDAERLCDALSRLVDDASLRRDLGVAARAYHHRHLEIGGYLRRLDALWDSVARDAAASDAPRG